MVTKAFYFVRKTAGVSLIVGLACIAQFARADITATLSADVIGEYETVTLSVKDRTGSDAEPDFSVLASDFGMSNVSTSSQISIVNGRYDSMKSWSLELTPKRTGTIDIPPIPFGSEFTNGLRLQVNPVSQREREHIRETAFFETLVSHEEQYPQAAIYITRRLLYTDQTRIPSLSQQKNLEIADATVLPLGSRESLRESRGNRSYFVMQWRYVAFAEKSGSLTIPGESARIGIYGNRFRPQVRTIVAKEKSVRILPIPSEYPREAPWFPASDVQLNQTYEPVGLTTLAIGDAVTRTIEVQAKNSYESALLPLELGSIDGLRVYPEQALLDTVLQGDVVWGTQSRTFNLIPFESGSVEIPEFKLTWWDIETKQVRHATLPSLALDTPDPSRQSGTQVGATDANLLGSVDVTAMQTNPTQSNFWFNVVAGIAFVGWGVALFLLIREKRRSHVANATNQSANIDYGAIRRAIHAADPAMLRNAIVRVTGRHADVSLVKARNLLLASESGRELLENLDRQAYGASAEACEFDFKNIKQTIELIVENYTSSQKEPSILALAN